MLLAKTAVYFLDGLSVSGVFTVATSNETAHLSPIIALSPSVVMHTNIRSPGSAAVHTEARCLVLSSGAEQQRTIWRNFSHTLEFSGGPTHENNQLHHVFRVGALVKNEGEGNDASAAGFELIVHVVRHLFASMNNEDERLTFSKAERCSVQIEPTTATRHSLMKSSSGIGFIR